MVVQTIFDREPKINLEDKMYLKTYYHHKPSQIPVDETPTKVKIQELYITRWYLIKDQHGNKRQSINN